MKLQLIFTASLLFFLSACDSTSEPEEEPTTSVDFEVYEARINSLIPTPYNTEVGKDEFVFNAQTIVYVHEDFKREGELFAEWFQQTTGFALAVKNITEAEDKKQNCVLLDFHPKDLSEMGLVDGYHEVLVTNDFVEVISKTGYGISNGIQTIKQLLPVSPQNMGGEQIWSVPEIDITDAPHFEHRGLLLDCSRHFMEKDFVKRYIDLLAYHKMNVLHWHLTEDQGWRIEIKKYPKLTEIGAWRDDGENGKYGGFYTQDDIREIVAYASERHVRIIPEIELPGHSQAALAAYPEYSCTGGPFEVETEWGVFREIYCAGNDETFQFLEDVLTEVMELFPGEYIHIGGDEAPKYRWENCSKCQKRIKDEGLHDEHELQSYFITRIEKFLNDNDKKLIGWDEILEGGLSPNATVQSWRGMEGGIKAAQSGHDVIMSPTSHCYFDYDLKAIDMGKVYEFDPSPSELGSGEWDHILGAECNMWSERAPQNTVDSKVFPRILAMAEILWKYPTERDYQAFRKKVKGHYPRLKAMGVDYGFETVPVRFSSKINDDGKIEVALEKGADDFELKYRWTNTLGVTEGEEGITYETPVEATLDGDNLLALSAYHNGDLLDEFFRMYSNHSGVGKSLTLGYEYSPHYAASGDNALVDGCRGTVDFRDGNWQAVQKEDLSATVDLGEVQSVNFISTSYFQYNNSWIFAPVNVEYFVSEDGENWTSVAEFDKEYDPEQRGTWIRDFTSELDGVSARYVKFVAKNIEYCPTWHEAAGSKAWLFVDEFIIR